MSKIMFFDKNLYSVDLKNPATFEKVNLNIMHCFNENFPLYVEKIAIAHCISYKNKFFKKEICIVYFENHKYIYQTNLVC